MMHPSTCLGHVSSRIGYGVFASAKIPRGSIVYVKDSLEIMVDPTEYQTLHPIARAQVDRYSYIEPGGLRVMSWDLAKYVNHSCDPNTLSCGWGFEIAVRDIEAGEQITDDYGLLNLTESMPCSCSTAMCRGRVGPGDLQKMHGHWDALVQAAIDLVPWVAQPLYDVIDADARETLQDYLAGSSAYRSVRELECHSHIPTVTHRERTALER